MGLGWMTRGSYRDPTQERIRRRRNRGIGLIAGGEPVTARKWPGLAKEVSNLFIEKRWTMVYCGMGSGLAGAIAKRILAADCKVRAIVVEDCDPPDLPQGVVKANVKNFHQRRSRLFRDPVAFLVLPGGPGTLGEFTELASWQGAGILQKPIVLLDPDNWFEPIVHFYEKAKRSKVSQWPTRQMFHRVPDANLAGKLLAEAIEDLGD